MVYPARKCRGDEPSRSPTTLSIRQTQKEGDNKFTGKIHSVTIDLKETKTAGSGAIDYAMHEASKRKTLSD